MPTLAFRTEVPAQPYDLILGRPTDTSVTLSVLAYQAMHAQISYGLNPDKLDQRLTDVELAAGVPVEVKFARLEPNTRYYYRVTPTKETDGPVTAASFMTARPPGAEFSFTMQADSHLDAGTEPEIYRRSLANVLASGADFHVDLGDTFMTDKRTAFREAFPQYLAQRYYFGLIGHSVPVFLTLGNHDGEETSRGGSGPDSMAVWSNTMRKKYFPNPEPNEFYSGNRTPQKYAGLLQDYYAWEWGDALFVVLDPFWFTTERSREGNNWPRTLGRPQYDWLKRTLEMSRAKFKFIFIHHLVGGEGKEGRGGSEAAKYFEWGGREPDGRDTFAKNRPGWLMPIHDLLVANHVSAVFHGHDHLYVRQELDGIIYQEVPQPGHPKANARSAEAYGYRSGKVLPGSGILRVRVSASEAVVEFLVAGSATKTVPESAYTYTIKPR